MSRGLPSIQNAREEATGQEVPVLDPWGSSFDTIFLGFERAWKKLDMRFETTNSSVGGAAAIDPIERDRVDS